MILKKQRLTNQVNILKYIDYLLLKFYTVENEDVESGSQDEKTEDSVEKNDETANENIDSEDSNQINDNESNDNSGVKDTIKIGTTGESTVLAESGKKALESKGYNVEIVVFNPLFFKKQCRFEIFMWIIRRCPLLQSVTF